MKNLFLTISGVLYIGVALIHVLRIVMKWPVVIGPVVVSATASLVAIVILLALSAGCFVAKNK